MLKFYNYDIVFQEFPDEVTLAINLTNCPCHCKGCHSPQLWKNVGSPLTIEVLRYLIHYYCGAITCVALMGGDNDQREVLRLLSMVRQENPTLKTGWYSGRDELSEWLQHYESPDYVKIGHYDERLGGLASHSTNQKLYYHGDNITARFWDRFMTN